MPVTNIVVLGSEDAFELDSRMRNLVGIDVKDVDRRSFVIRCPLGNPGGHAGDATDPIVETSGLESRCQAGANAGSC